MPRMDLPFFNMHQVLGFGEMDKPGQFLRMPPPLRKVTAPLLPFMIVHREALVQRLTEAVVGNAPGYPASFPHYKLILLEAPAGYGKTTLLTEFSLQSSITCCWYFLDRSDTEPIAFLRVLLASLQQSFPAFGTQLVPLLNSIARSTESSDPYKFLDALVDTLAAEIPQRFALLLCNYQEVNAYPEITSLVEYLLNRLPVQGVLVLESREIPELDFASLLAGRAMLGVGRELLRFSPQEIRMLARVQNSRELSVDEAERLASAFDGWITGLLLGTRLGDVQLLQRGYAAPLSLEKQGIQIHAQTLFSYVANEVFKRHQQMYAFLKEAVVLQEMTPPLCSNLLGITLTEAGERLQYLEQHGLFVTHNGEGAQLVYTCHPILRDLLYEELREQNPKRFVQLHQRAAELLSVSRRYKQAIHHALEANIDELAAQLIVASAELMMEQGHMEALQQWIAAFSEEIIARYPRLLLIQAGAFLEKSELHAALPLLEKLAELLNGSSQGVLATEDLSRLQAELAIVRVRALIQQGRYSQARHLCQQVLQSLPVDEVALRTRAHLYFGACAQFLGDLTTKITHYQKALQLWGRHTVSSLTADGHSSLAEAYGMLGRFALAEHHSSRALACWEQLQNIPGIVTHLIIQADITWNQGRFDEAECLLQRALALTSRSLHLRRWRGYILVKLGEFYLDQGLYDRSLASAEEGLALARQLGDTYLLNHALMTLSMIYLYMGDAATARLLLSEAHLEETPEASARSYQQVLQELTLGTIWLHQRHSAEAHPLLVSAESALSTMGIKREQLKALVRLAACHLEQKQPAKAFERLAAVELILTTIDGYEQLVRAEVRMFPFLQCAIEQRPEGASLRALLYWKPNGQEPALRDIGGEVSTPAATYPPAEFAAPNSTPQIKILALGEPAVLVNEQPVTHWRMARAVELCFYLLECGQPVRKEQILAAVWGEVDDHARRTFYSTIHYLRKALGGEAAITSRAGIYMLDLALVYGEKRVWYDVTVFEEQYALGKQALAEETDEIAKAAFEAMIKLYRGDYLQSFDSSWCVLRRDDLRRLYLDACQQLAQLAWRSEKIEESIIHWQQMLTVDACLEEAHYGLMRCYMRQGKRGLALRQYRCCTRTLQQELGVVPGPAMHNLYRRLMGSSRAGTGLS